MKIQSQQSCKVSAENSVMGMALCFRFKNKQTTQTPNKPTPQTKPKQLCFFSISIYCDIYLYSGGNNRIYVCNCNEQNFDGKYNVGGGGKPHQIYLLHQT